MAARRWAPPPDPDFGAAIAEVFIVAEGCGVQPQTEVSIDSLGLRVIPLDPAAARRVPLPANGRVAVCGASTGLCRSRRATHAGLSVISADAGDKAQRGRRATGRAEPWSPSPCSPRCATPMSASSPGGVRALTAASSEGRATTCSEREPPSSPGSTSRRPKSVRFCATNSLRRRCDHCRHTR